MCVRARFDCRVYGMCVACEAPCVRVVWTCARKSHSRNVSVCTPCADDERNPSRTSPHCSTFPFRVARSGSAWCWLLAVTEEPGAGRPP